MKAAIPILMTVLLVGCTSGPVPELKLTGREQADLDKVLAGKVAGTPVSCVSAFGVGANLRAISDDVLVYEVSRKLAYKNRLIGSCTGLSRGDTLVLNLHGSQYCRGDIARAVSLPSGFSGGSCSLGDFVPYRVPDSGG
jgi:hypothetical protein